MGCVYKTGLLGLRESVVYALPALGNACTVGTIFTVPLTEETKVSLGLLL